MIITDLYQTKIECLHPTNLTPYYNVNIGSTVKVVVSLIDFNGEPVIAKENVVITVDNGSIQSNGTGTISTDAKTIIDTTDNNGQITFTYQASVFGTITFRVNDKSIKIKVTGRKTKYESTGGDVRLFDYNDEYYLLRFNGSVLNCTKQWTVWKQIDASYAPIQTVAGVIFSPSNPYLCALGVRLNTTNNTCEILKKSLTQDNVDISNGHLSLFWTKRNKIGV